MVPWGRGRTAAGLRQPSNLSLFKEMEVPRPREERDRGTAHGAVVVGWPIGSVSTASSTNRMRSINRTDVSRAWSRRIGRSVRVPGAPHRFQRRLASRHKNRSQKSLMSFFASVVAFPQLFRVSESGIRWRLSGFLPTRPPLVHRTLSAPPEAPNNAFKFHAARQPCEFASTALPRSGASAPSPI
jgi:hypothetical protein